MSSFQSQVPFRTSKCWVPNCKVYSKWTVTLSIARRVPGSKEFRSVHEDAAGAERWFQSQAEPRCAQPVGKEEMGSGGFRF